MLELLVRGAPLAVPCGAVTDTGPVPSCAPSEGDLIAFSSWTSSFAFTIQSDSRSSKVGPGVGAFKSSPSSLSDESKKREFSKSISIT